MHITSFNKHLQTFLVFFVLLIPCTSSFDSSLFGQARRHIVQTEIIDGYRVTRGIRPPMHFSVKDSAAWYPGKLIIKFEHVLSGHFEANTPGIDKNDQVVFHLEQVDSLNKRYGATAFEQYFLSPALNNTFSERHKAWGFHLWYTLDIPSDADIPAMISNYQGLAEIETAVPAFRKVHHGKQLDLDAFTLSTYFDREEGWIPDDIYFGSQWHFKNTGQHQGLPGADISLPQAWEIERGDSTVLVAVIDTGMDGTHEDLAGNMWHQLGYNFTNNSTNIEPSNHGSVVGGVVAAVSNNSTGVAGIAGGTGNNDGARLMALQVFSDQGNHGFHIAPIFAADNGAAISQNSWGYSTPGYYSPGILDAIDYFNQNGGGEVLEGGITFTSAGNSNSSEDFYPAYYPGVFSVTATNNQDKKAWYSNFGNYHDLAAPGGETNIVPQRGILSTRVNNGYGFSQGTSLSCPSVSGVAAMLISYAYRNNHILTNTQVWDLLVENADDINEHNPEYHNLLGAGRLNALKVMEAVADIIDGVPAPVSFSATAVDNEQVNLEWTSNLLNDDVLLLFSYDEAFGTPVSGTLYEQGDQIPGGGTVLFMGKNNTFSHTGLQEHTDYHYKIFSYDESFIYSTGRTDRTRTYGPQLTVTGLNRQYTSIPLSQLPPSMALQARVFNKDYPLNHDSYLHFSVPEANYYTTARLHAPLDAGDETIVCAEPAWQTMNLKTGNYSIIYEADHEGSLEENRTDLFIFSVTDSLYSRDNGNIFNGIGSNSGPIILGMKYKVHQAAKLAAVQMQWPNLPLSELDFRLALYELDDDRNIIRTVFVSDLFTRTPCMRNETHDFMLIRPAFMAPGNYMLAFKQLTTTNLTVGFDNEAGGYFYRSNSSSAPISFPYKNKEYGNLAMRMILYESDLPTNIVQSVENEEVMVWFHNNSIFIDNPGESIQFSLHDVGGRLLQRFTAGNGLHSYPVSFPAGIYILHFQGTPMATSKKIIIE